MRKTFIRFLEEECGAVTIDWVVLTAAVVALAVLVFSILDAASGGVGSGVKDYLSTLTVGGN